MEIQSSSVTRTHCLQNSYYSMRINSLQKPRESIVDILILTIVSIVSLSLSRTTLFSNFDMIHRL